MAAAGIGRAASGSVVRVVYFYANDCPHCIAVIDEVLKPLQAQYGERLQIKMIEITAPDHYELLVRAEEIYGVAPEERGLPTLVVGSRVLIGEDAIREELPCILETCLASEGTEWPAIPGLEAVTDGDEAIPLGAGVGGGGAVVAPCPADEPEMDVCRDAPVIRVAYFYQVGCRECDRAERDLRYIRERHPHVVVDEFSIFDDLALAQWLAERIGRGADVHAPAVFVGDDALIGAEELTPQNLEALIEKYTPSGARPVWADYQPAERVGTSMLGVGTIALAGLVDGLNPCAFATLVFFVSYLTLSGRSGWQVLAVGIAFTLGVFLAYLAIGLGLYRVLELVRDQHALGARVVYALTALLCLVLAVLSVVDFVKARRGGAKDMTLVLPEVLRRHIHRVIRTTAAQRAFVGVALVSGLAISLLELACTGQVYFATLVSMANMPGAQAQALPLLILYCLMFTVPLIVVFVLAYFGTSSLQLGVFLRRHTPTVKLATALLFLAFGVWLIVTLVSQAV